MGIRACIVRHVGAVIAGNCMIVAGSLMGASAVRADLQVCNGTTGRVGVSIGYKGGSGNWITEGWWNLPPHACERLIKGTLSARFYYVYAIDYDSGGEWHGQAFMCTREKEFLIQGVDDCLARGYDRTGFVEIDTGQQSSWTIQLTDVPQSQNPKRSAVPELPILPGRQGPPIGPPFGNQK